MYTFFDKFWNSQILRTTLLKFSAYMTEYRKRVGNSIRTNLKQIQEFHISIQILVFVYALLKIISLRYQKQSFSYFIYKNVPGVSLPYQSLSWQTFQHIRIYDFVKNSDAIKKIDIYDDVILFELDSKFKNYQKQSYIGIFNSESTMPKSEDEIVSFPSKPLKLFVIKSRDSSFNPFYLDLDEFPNKLNSVFIKELKILDIDDVKESTIVDYSTKESIMIGEKQSQHSLSENLLDQLYPPVNNDSKKLEKKILPDSTFSRQKNGDIKKFCLQDIFQYTPPYRSKLVGVPKNLEESVFVDKNLIETVASSYTAKTNFLKKNYFLQNEILSFYQNNGFLPFHDIELLTNDPFKQSKTNQEDWLTKFLPSKFSDFFNVSYEDILENINDFLPTIPNHFLSVRKMSGYEFPDMETKEVYSYLLTSFYLKSFNVYNLNRHCLKIPLPPNILISNVYTIPYRSIPKLGIKYRPIRLKGIDHIEIVYQGLGVALDRKSNDLDLHNKDEFQKWIQRYFSSDNPLKDQIQNFFENNKLHLEEDAFKIYSKSQRYSQNKNIKFIEKLPNLLSKKAARFYKENKFHHLDGEMSKLVTNRLHSIGRHFPELSTEEVFKVPYINNLQWVHHLKKIKDAHNKQNPNDEKKPIQIFVPLMRIKLPKISETSLFWPLSTFDYVPIDLFFQNPSLSKLTTYHYFPSSQLIFDTFATEKHYFGSVYRKVLSVYSNPQKSVVDKISRKMSRFTKVFYDPSEPISSGSWMVITQISLALFSIYILQEFNKQYRKELISYILELAASVGFLDESVKESLGLDEAGKGYRIINKVNKKFKNLVGIDTILPEVSEIVWFLRNSGRSFNLGNVLPKGFLLFGPPGTGKTLLVQAIAGEAEVPVLVQAGTSLKEGGSAVDRLYDLFQEARILAPCIIFIDEIDTLGRKRENIIKNPMGDDEVLDSVYGYEPQSKSELLFDAEKFIPKSTPESMEEPDEEELREREFALTQMQPVDTGYPGSRSSSAIKATKAMQKAMDKNQASYKQLGILMQFLIELDGLSSRKGIIVIGATNRPAVLDPALIRPGRFDQILHLELPGKQKRIEILKYYTKNLGIDSKISWEYLANRTVGFSAADLATAMNQSSIQAILHETIHTLNTIEYGIDRISMYNFEKPKLKLKQFKDPFFILRLAYYQAGKAIIHTLLPDHPNAVVLHLWPRSKAIRHINLVSLLQKDLSQIIRKKQMEVRLIGLYAGKAAEMLMLVYHSFSVKLSSNSLFRNPNFVKNLSNNALAQENLLIWQSNLGHQDITYGSFLANIMIDKWYLLSKKILSEQFFQLLRDRNLKEFKDSDILEVYSVLRDELEYEIVYDTQRRKSKAGRTYQKRAYRAWWQIQVMKRVGFLDLRYNEWYRIYLPDPQERERNQEWVPPDKYYHTNEILMNAKLVKLDAFANSLSLFFKGDQENQEENTVTNITETVDTEEIPDSEETVDTKEIPDSEEIVDTKEIPDSEEIVDTKEIPDSEEIVDTKEIPDSEETVDTEEIPDSEETVDTEEAVDSAETNDTEEKKDINSKQEDEKEVESIEIERFDWNDLYKIERDYLYHGLILNAFNKAFCMLEEHRELVDSLVDYILRHEIIREYEIELFISQFVSDTLKKELDSENNLPSFSEQLELKFSKSKTVSIEKSWGIPTRRPNSRFIEFDKLNEFTSKNSP